MITEDQLEQICLVWFREGGYEYAFGPDIAHDGEVPERVDYSEGLGRRARVGPRQLIVMLM